MADEQDASFAKPEADSDSSSAASEQSRRSAAARDPLHGVTLQQMLMRLVARHGWEQMGTQIPIRCFLFEPSVNSSLKFLRRTPWARKKVEDWYAYDARRFPMDKYDEDSAAE